MAALALHAPGSALPLSSWCHSAHLDPIPTWAYSAWVYWYQFPGILVSWTLAWLLPPPCPRLWLSSGLMPKPQVSLSVHAINSVMGMGSDIFLCMAMERDVAICYHFQYPSVVTEVFVIKVILWYSEMPCWPSQCLCLLPRDTAAPGMRLTSACALT